MNDKNILHDTAEKMHFESVKILHKNIIVAWFNPKPHVMMRVEVDKLKNQIKIQ